MRLPIYLSVQEHGGLIDEAEKWAKRIGSVSFRIEPAYWKPPDLRRAMTICDCVDGKIALCSGPFAGWILPRYPKDRPATDRSVEYIREMDSYRAQYKQIAKELGSRTDLVGAILIDAEYWKRSADPVHNKAMAETLDTLYEIAAAEFPKARIEFYCRGVYWDKPSPYWTELEKHVPGLSVSMSLPNFPFVMTRWFEETVKIAKARGLTTITPFVHIGGGYIGKAAEYNPDLPVDPENARWLGAYLAASPFVRQIVIHPAPTGTDNWTNHFNNFMAGLGQ